MAAREIRDEQQSQETPQEAPSQKSPIQIQISEEGEKNLLAMIQSDFKAAEKARNEKDMGITSKGERLDFDEWYKQIIDLYNSRREPKTVPWRFASNRSLRIATAILDTMHARLLPTVLNEDLLRWNPGETTDAPKIERINKMMHWWVWVRSKQQSFFDVWTKLIIGFGDGLTETTWNVDVTDSGESVQTPVQDESGQQVLEEDGQPSVLESRKLNIVETSQSFTYMKDKVYLQQGSTNIQQEPVLLGRDIFYRDLEKGEAEGKFVNVSNLLRAAIPVGGMPNDVGPEESERLRTSGLRNKMVKVFVWYGNFDADGDGFEENVRCIVSLEHKIYLGGIAVKNLTKSGKRPIDFTKFDNRLDRPNENDGEGILEKTKELAEEIDAIFNQLTDANTLSILRPGFYDPAGDLDAPVLKLAPNKMTPVSDPSRNVVFPDMSINIQQLLLAIRLVLEFVERLTAASAFVLGKESETVGGSGTATRTNAILQSAETRFERPAERLRAGAARIISQHLDILQLNIPPGLETRVMGEKGEPIFDSNELTQEGISGEFDAYMLPDPSMGSKQIERDLAQMFYTVLLQNPIVGTDPFKIYKITADLIKSWNKNPVDYLGPAPSSDDIDDPQDENTLILQGDFARVTAQITENHLLHMQEHMAFLESPSLAQLPPHLLNQVSNFTQQHIQQHEQMMQLMIAITQKQVGGGGGGGNSFGQGSEDGDSGGSQGPPEKQGLEQAPGVLGQALDSKRKGESGPTA